MARGTTPPDPPAGMAAATPQQWMRVWVRVIAHPSVKHVGCWCAYFAGYGDGANIHPGNDVLGAVSGGLSDKTVRLALAQMRDWRLIWRYFEGAKAGRRGKSDIYRLTIPEDVLDRVPMLTPEHGQPVDNPSGTPVLRTAVLTTPVLETRNTGTENPGTPVLTTAHHNQVPNQVDHLTTSDLDVANLTVEDRGLSTGEPSGAEVIAGGRPTRWRDPAQKALAQLAESRAARETQEAGTA